MSIYPAALAAHLEGETTTVCHCWRLTRRDGVIKGFTDHDRRLTVNGDIFQPLSGFTATEARDTLGLAVDTVDVEGALSSDDIGEADIAAGLYDDAVVETLLVNWATPAQFARLRSATIGKITRRDNAFVAELKSRTHRLDEINGRVVGAQMRRSARRSSLPVRARPVRVLGVRDGGGSIDAREHRGIGVEQLRARLVRSGHDRMDGRCVGGTQILCHRPSQGCERRHADAAGGGGRRAAAGRCFHDPRRLRQGFCDLQGEVR